MILILLLLLSTYPSRRALSTTMLSTLVSLLSALGFVPYITAHSGLDPSRYGSLLL